MEYGWLSIPLCLYSTALFYQGGRTRNWFDEQYRTEPELNDEFAFDASSLRCNYRYVIRWEKLWNSGSLEFCITVMFGIYCHEQLVFFTLELWKASTHNITWLFYLWIWRIRMFKVLYSFRPWEPPHGSPWGPCVPFWSTLNPLPYKDDSCCKFD